MASSSTPRSSGTVLDIELNEHEQASPLTDEEVGFKPWKYIGYRGYADFISSDDDLFILRRFDTLNVRVILAQQDRLSELEHELAEVDQRNSQRDAPDVNNGTIRNDIEDRRLLLDDIRKEIHRYNKMILQQSSLREYTTAPLRDIKNIRNWHFNYGKSAIAKEEQDYLHERHEHDLICVTHKSKTPLRKFIDKSRRLRTLGAWRKKDDKPVPQYNSPYVSYYSDERIDGFASGFIVLVGLAMLVTPIWVLNSLESMDSRLIVITIFTVVFLLVMSFAMVAKPFEALGATAAYAAVLMVFMQLGSD